MVCLDRGVGDPAGLVCLIRVLTSGLFEQVSVTTFAEIEDVHAGAESLGLDRVGVEQAGSSASRRWPGRPSPAGAGSMRGSTAPAGTPSS